MVSEGEALINSLREEMEKNSQLREQLSKKEQVALLNWARKCVVMCVAYYQYSTLYLFQVLPFRRISALLKITGIAIICMQVVGGIYILEKPLIIFSFKCRTTPK